MKVYACQWKVRAVLGQEIVKLVPADPVVGIAYTH